MIVVSSSFYTKDSILEFLVGSGEVVIFLILISGRIFTLIYRASILKRLSALKRRLVVIFSQKFFLFKFFVYFGVIRICCLKLWQELILNNFRYVVNRSVILMLTLVLLVTSIFGYFPSKNKFFFFLSRSVFFIKETSFSIFIAPIDKRSLIFFQSDQGIFKPSNLIFGGKINYEFKFISFFFLYSYFSFNFNNISY